MRLTNIICTLGPTTNSEEGIRSLMRAGMNIARMNFSHGDQAGHTAVIRRVRKINKEEGKHIALMLDTKGAEIRTNDRAEPLMVTKDQIVVFSHKKIDKKRPTLTVTYPEFWKDVKNADCILIDNGEIIFDAIETSKDWVVARARGPGKIGSRRHVNLPGADVSLPSVTEKDWLDIKLACKEKLDFIALSFVRNAKEIEAVRTFTKKHGHPDIQLIAKIENAVAVRNIAEIVRASDGVMVARGDLGAEVPVEAVPAIQDDIVSRCKAAGKPVIVATHMLESMIKNPLPTRAEVTDIAHAAVTQADCTMLSGETASGAHPLEAIGVMARVLAATERRLPFHPPVSGGDSEEEAHAIAAINMAHTLKASAIILFVRSGRTTRAVSRLRPQIPVIACTDKEDVARRMQILYGIDPMVTKFQKSADKTIAEVFAVLKKRKILAAGNHVIVLATVLDGKQRVHTSQSRIIP